MKYSYKPIRNFSNADTPVYHGSYLPTRLYEKSTITVASWNIKQSQNIKVALKEIISIPTLHAVEIFLLQEMDYASIDFMACRLKMAYVYAPAHINNKTDKMFGNGILSKYPLYSPYKKILPYKSVLTSQTRNMITAHIRINGKKIPVSSVHSELSLLNPITRTKHRRHVFDESLFDVPYRIIGGDFNTLRKSTVKKLTLIAKEKGYINITSADKSTFRIFTFSRTLDHLFFKGFTLIEHGVLTKTQASDHFPIWAVVSLPIRN
jgi:endonuclease/exonuclease/phosphatase family metal-dependent hydrolase